MFGNASSMTDMANLLQIYLSFTNPKLFAFHQRFDAGTKYYKNIYQNKIIFLITLSEFSIAI